MLPCLQIAWSHMSLSIRYLYDTISALKSCLESLQAWFCANSMTLNADKSNAVLFATSQRAQSLSNQVSVNISGVTVPLSNHVTLSEHTKAISKSCFYHIRALKHIHDSLDSSTIRTIDAALVTSRLDYANSVLYGIPTKYISRLQRTQNTLARVVAGNRTPVSHLATLSKLHWLPVHDRIKFKIMLQ